MQVSLEGPNDLGFWFLSDEDGNSFPFITSHEDHPIAAAMLGWKQPERLEDQEEIIMDALDWLMENTGEIFEAPQQVGEYFKELYNEQDE